MKQEKLIDITVDVEEARQMMVQAGWRHEVINLIFSGFVPSWPVKVGKYMLHIRDAKRPSSMDVDGD